MASWAAAVSILLAALGAHAACTAAAPRTDQPSFSTPEDAVRALLAASKTDNLDAIVALFGPEGRDLIDQSDRETARRNRQVIVAAAAEKWTLDDGGQDRRVLVIGNERWPFPVPLVKGPSGWRFDTAAGKEEILSRRIGRNELAVIRIARTYVAAQKIYALRGRDGQPPGRYAKTFRSDPGRQNGLYWATARGQRRSPLGNLVAEAANEGRQPRAEGQPPSPFHGYYFRILTAQGATANGGAKDYIVNGELTGGFALVAWPASYLTTGLMTFIVNQEGVVYEKDLGPDTEAAATAMTLYSPDPSWERAP